MLSSPFLDVLQYIFYTPAITTINFRTFNHFRKEEHKLISSHFPFLPTAPIIRVTNLFPPLSANYHHFM